ncbi:copper-binding protein [Microvirga sp. Mcv34]|uniref:copper-binding protein n=1 Tax=Microvirga sp. Mcv34 TaxID=2926016 RepID=UPI0021C84A37|nr:copper-binding protein [Microvirga sp. Mcv34]
MKRLSATLASLLVFGTGAIVATQHLAQAQPAKGAASSFERVREVTNNRFRDMKLVGDPDQDFAAMLLAHYENIIFLAKTQLDFGGDRELRQIAQKIHDDQQKQIDTIKEWQVRMRQPGYQAQPNQSPPGSGPLDRQAQAAPAPTPAAPPTQTAQTPTASPQTSQAPLPLVSGTVEKVDTAQSKLTIDHGPIPNLNMDGMTMVFRAQDPAMLKSVKQGDKVQFSADRVNGQLTVTKIQKAR